MSDPQKIEATLAFVFNTDLSKVILIKKEKPIQHAGLLNGLGGKLELGETHLACVVREVEEEAAIHIDAQDWRTVGTISWSHWQVSIWTAVTNVAVSTHFSDKNVSWYSVDSLPENIIENLTWLIPLSADILQKVQKNEISVPVVNIVYG